MRAFLVAVLLAACSQSNPAYVGGPGDASAGPDAPSVDVSTSGAPDTVADRAADRAADAAADVAPDRAVDGAADRAADTLPATTLRGSYYNGDNFDTFVFSRVDQIIDFPWANDPPDPRLTFNEFSVRWTGTIRPRYSETYTFTTHSGDGMRVTINGVLVVDDWRVHAPEDYSGTIQLTANRAYDLKVEYFHLTGWSVARLSWESATQGKEVVPAAAYAP